MFFLHNLKHLLVGGRAKNLCENYILYVCFLLKNIATRKLFIHM